VRWWRRRVPDLDEELAELLDGALELAELEELAAHRTCRLLELDFSFEQVLRMKVYRRGFEWHRAEQLLKDGKTHEQTTWLLED